MTLTRYLEEDDLRGTVSLVRGELDSEGRRSRLVGEATLTSLDRKLGAIHRTAADPDYLLFISDIYQVVPGL